MRVWQKTAIYMIALCIGPIAAAAQADTTITPDLAEKAIHVVTLKSVLDAAALAPKTGKPLPATGKFSVSQTRPEACPQTAEPCVTVFYRVPDAEVACEWTVLLEGDASTDRLIAENDDAARYFILRLAPNEAAAFVQSRAVAQEPPIARLYHVVGDVVVRVVIGTDGVPEQVFATSGPEMLKGAAFEAGKKWRFKPCTVGGRAVRYQMEITFMFRAAGYEYNPPVAMKP